jgi:hypothetical protein
MATIVNNPATERERVVDNSDNGGWAVAVIVLLAVVLIGAFVWMRYYQAPAASQSQQPGSANINVTLPNNGTDNTGDTQSGTPSTNNPATNPAVQ